MCSVLVGKEIKGVEEIHTELDHFRPCCVEAIGTNERFGILANADARIRMNGITC